MRPYRRANTNAVQKRAILRRNYVVAAAVGLILVLLLVWLYSAPGSLVPAGDQEAVENFLIGGDSGNEKETEEQSRTSLSLDPEPSSAEKDKIADNTGTEDSSEADEDKPADKLGSEEGDDPVRGFGRDDENPKVGESGSSLSETEKTNQTLGFPVVGKDLGKGLENLNSTAEEQVEGSKSNSVREDLEEGANLEALARDSKEIRRGSGKTNGTDELKGGGIGGPEESEGDISRTKGSGGGKNDDSDESEEGEVDSTEQPGGGKSGSVKGSEGGKDGGFEGGKSGEESGGEKAGATKDSEGVKSGGIEESERGEEEGLEKEELKDSGDGEGNSGDGELDSEGTQGSTKTRVQGKAVQGEGVEESSDEGMKSGKVGEAFEKKGEGQGKGGFGGLEAKEGEGGKGEEGSETEEEEKDKEEGSLEKTASGLGEVKGENEENEDKEVGGLENGAVGKGKGGLKDEGGIEEEGAGGDEDSKETKASEDKVGIKTVAKGMAPGNVGGQVKTTEGADEEEAGGAEEGSETVGGVTANGNMTGGAESKVEEEESNAEDEGEQVAGADLPKGEGSKAETTGGVFPSEGETELTSAEDSGDGVQAEGEAKSAHEEESEGAGSGKSLGEEGDGIEGEETESVKGGSEAGALESEGEEGEDEGAAERRSDVEQRATSSGAKTLLPGTLPTSPSKEAGTSGGERSTTGQRSGSGTLRSSMDEATSSPVPWKDEQGKSTTGQKSGSGTLRSSTDKTSSSSVQSASTPTSAGSSLSQTTSADMVPAKESYSWPLCPEEKTHYVPCLDNKRDLMRLRNSQHFENRERHCPQEGDAEDCLVPLPAGYKAKINWPQSKDEIWFSNVPFAKLTEYKASQNWVRLEGDKLTFPGGGTQFTNGAGKYIEYLQDTLPAIAWGKHVKVALDIGCGVASFSAALLPLGVRVMAFAPRDEHDAQVQMALERGLPAVLAVMGTQRLNYPSKVFDAIHCARCRVKWHLDGGRLLFELNRVLRPGGFFLWSATPVYKKGQEDEEAWAGVTAIAERMCWTMVAKDVSFERRGVAIWQKPLNNTCYDGRAREVEPPLCPADEDADAAWYVPMKDCIHRGPSAADDRGARWPAPSVPAGTKATRHDRLFAVPYWLSSTRKGITGVPETEEFTREHDRWARVYRSEYANKMGIDWTTVRNVIDGNALYGGFGATLEHHQAQVWTLSLVSPWAPRAALPAVYERGLLGLLHDWCEACSTYPRTYDLLHLNRLLEPTAKRCDPVRVLLEADRILRPTAYIIIRERPRFKNLIQSVAAGLHWNLTYIQESKPEVVFTYQKTFWRPEPTTTRKSRS